MQKLLQDSRGEMRVDLTGAGDGGHRSSGSEEYFDG